MCLMALLLNLPFVPKMVLLVIPGMALWWFFFYHVVAKWMVGGLEIPE